MTSVFFLSIKLFNRNQICSPSITLGPANPDKFAFRHKYKYVNCVIGKNYIYILNWLYACLHLIFSGTQLHLTMYRMLRSSGAVLMKTCSFQEHRELQIFETFLSEGEMYDFTVFTYRRSYFGRKR